MQAANEVFAHQVNNSHGNPWEEKQVKYSEKYCKTPTQWTGNSRGFPNNCERHVAT